MNGAAGFSLNNLQGNRAAFTPGTVDFTETMALAKSSMKDTFRLLSASFLGAQTIEVPGNTKLEAPKKLSMDANLLLAGLQDTLNQLMQKVSVNDIKHNLQTQNDAGKKQLEDMRQAAVDAAAAAAKQKEADKKGNVFEAISNWVQAAVSVISIVFTAIAAVGQALSGNFVAAGALFVAVGAMGVQLGCQLALAIDATMKASGVEGGLGIDIELCKKVMEIAGYVALAASMIGMIGGIASSMQSAAKQGMAQATAKVASQTSSQAGQLMGEISEETTKQMITESAKQMTKELAKEMIKPIMLFSRQLAFTAAVGQAGTATTKAIGKEATKELLEDASTLQGQADNKLADVEAMKAMIVKLQAMIEQLQQALEDQMDKGQNLMQSLLAPITDRMKTMQTLVQNIGA
jgi:hypothetical protein